MKSKGKIIAASAITVLSLATIVPFAHAGDDHGDTYGPYPVTLKGYSGSKKNSVSYSGQIARHVLHDSLNKLSSK